MIWLLLIVAVGLVLGFFLASSEGTRDLESEEEPLLEDELLLEDEQDAQDVLDILFLEEEEE